MREALKNAVQSAILFECQLPHQESGLGKSCLSSQNDICFNNTDPQEIAKVIYNGIVEFALNEYEINYDDLEREQRRAILSRIRYNPTADNSAKLKYGFYGEVLLDLILRVFLQTSVVAARGYFTHPLKIVRLKALMLSICWSATEISIYGLGKQNSICGTRMQ